MGSIYPSGHLIRSARSGVPFVPRRTLTYTPIRLAQDNSNNSSNNNNGTESKPSVFDKVKGFFFGKKDKRKVTRRGTTPLRREGALSADSIFAEDDTAPKLKSTGRTPKSQRDGAAAPAEVDYSVEKRNKTFLRAALDPRPRHRENWERKMITREIRRRGRLSRAVQIMRTERESLSRSHWFKTSIKKLGPLARQIAGKNIDDAILQMRFSKKKAAKDVVEHLEHAKNVALVRNGMGMASLEDKQEAKKNPATIILKSGDKHQITDPSSIYIAQAWVNRGPYGREYDHRGRGRINLLRPPHTGLSVLLKEEKTRLREWRDMQDKLLRERRSKLNVHLPDRKIYGQNQYYSW